MPGPPSRNVISTSSCQPPPTKPVFLSRAILKPSIYYEPEQQQAKQKKAVHFSSCSQSRHHQSPQAQEPRQAPSMEKHLYHAMTDMFMDGNTANEPKTESKTEEVYEDGFRPYNVFFYGELTDPNRLQRVLQTDQAPSLTSGCIQGYRQKMWGLFPAIVPDAIAFDHITPDVPIDPDLYDDATTPPSQDTTMAVPRVYGFYTEIKTAYQRDRLRDRIPCVYKLVPVDILVDMNADDKAFPNIPRLSSVPCEFVADGYSYVWAAADESLLDEGQFDMQIFHIHMALRTLDDIMAEYCEKDPENRKWVVCEDGIKRLIFRSGC